MSVNPDILCKLQVISDFDVYLSVCSILEFDRSKYFSNTSVCVRLTFGSQMWAVAWKWRERDFSCWSLCITSEKHRGFECKLVCSPDKHWVFSPPAPSPFRRWYWSWGVGESCFLAAWRPRDTACLRFSRRGWKTENMALLWASSYGGSRSCCCREGKCRSERLGTPRTKLLFKAITACTRAVG